MKIIDEKGRVFGSINVVDLVVILAIVAICAVVYKSMVMKKVNVLENKKPYEIQVLVKSILPQMAEQVKEKDIFLEDGSNAVLGEVINIQIDVTKNEVQTADGRIVIAPVETRRDIIITLKGTGKFDEQRGLMFGNKDWQAGGAIVIKSSKVKFGGNIYNITD